LVLPEPASLPVARFSSLPVGSTPDEFDGRFRADIAKFARIVKDARIPMQD
jgi:hypothetical protein